MTQLTDVKLKSTLPDGKPMQDSSVSGLRFEPGRQKGHGKWILRFVSPVTGKRRDMGLGRYPEVGLADARAKGVAARQVIANGNDPIDQRDAVITARKALVEALTFEQAARRVHEDSKDGWRNSKHRDQWINTLRDYAFPRIGAKKIASLAPSDFADVLRPIWLAKPETASRVKQRCHKVMKWSWANGFVQGNPVDVVDHLLPRQPGKRERVRHQPAMDWRAVPEFVTGLLRSGTTNITRSLMEFVILTAARSGEARAMHWDEVDEAGRTWTVPAERIKTKVEHRVPLSDAAMQILAAQREAHPNSSLVFPAPRGGVLSDMALTAFLRDQKAASSDKGRVATAHGFRSSFRDWASESGYARDLAEKALAHAIVNKTEAAYHRTDLLEQRRPMMDAWAAHVCGVDAGSNVVAMRRRK
jgi:integrase